MVVLLASILILGILAAVVLGGGTSTPRTVDVATPDNTVAACLSDLTTVDAAVQSYFAANLSDPPAGTAWATSSAKGGPYLNEWPKDPRFYRITWNGSTLLVVPARGRVTAGSVATSSPAAECRATGGVTAR